VLILEAVERFGTGTSSRNSEVLPAEHGVPGLVQLFGIESPGLTSCLAVAEHVEKLLDGAPR
jgi:L-2-hydroxyglutarate oxidase LhgO